MEPVNLFTIAVIALFSSFGHCVGMCSGIVLAYTTTKVKNNWSKKTQSLVHLLYSFGRVTSYTFIGIISGYLGSTTTINTTFSSIFLFITGFTMVLIGISLLFKVKLLSKLEFSVSKLSIYQKIFKSLISNDSHYSFYFLGMLNGFLPCSLVYLFALSAASTQSALGGFFVMLIFGLSTIPTLFSLGYFVSLVQNTNIRNLCIKISSILIVLFGFQLIYFAYAYFTDSMHLIHTLH